jgi:hypothetical protein
MTLGLFFIGLVLLAFGAASVSFRRRLARFETGHLNKRPALRSWVVVSEEDLPSGHFSRGLALALFGIALMIVPLANIVSDIGRIIVSAVVFILFACGMAFSVVSVISSFESFRRK